MEQAAGESQRAPAEYVQQLVGKYMGYDARFRQQVKKGLDQLDRGGFVTHEEMGLRIEKMLRS